MYLRTLRGPGDAYGQSPRLSPENPLLPDNQMRSIRQTSKVIGNQASTMPARRNVRIPLLRSPILSNWTRRLCLPRLDCSSFPVPSLRET